MKIDFTNYPLSGIRYGGSEKKAGILIDNCPYMLKFQKNTPFGKRFNHVSEYLGSHIYQMLGFECQKTYLGTYCGENVVACRDFTEDGYLFVPFNDVGESTIETDKDKYKYSYDDIVDLLKANQKLTNIEETVQLFFEMYIVDALTGNFDRHGANWGFLKKNNKYKLAPVFDNGSCLFPQMIDEDKMLEIMSSEEEINERVYKLPTSQILLDGRKSSYFEVISSLSFKEMNDALFKIYPKIQISKIFELIDEIDEISTIHKDFYKTIIKARYEKIIRFSYEKMVEER